MKLIVFSDSHGRTEMLRRAAEVHFADPDTAGVVHLVTELRIFRLLTRAACRYGASGEILRIICIPTVRAAMPLRAS